MKALALATAVGLGAVWVGRSVYSHRRPEGPEPAAPPDPGPVTSASLPRGPDSEAPIVPRPRAEFHDPLGAGGAGLRPWQHRFPNLELTTHQGKAVRFYDDLIKGRIVAINFMYCGCTKA